MERWQKHKKGMVNNMQLTELNNILDSCFWHIDQSIKYQEKSVKSLDYWKGYLYGVYKSLTAASFDDVIRTEFTEAEKSQYAYKETFIADEFTVAMNNNIYRQMNPDIEEMVVGQEYTETIEPWGLIEFNGEIFPVFADDPGQCDMVLIDGEFISGGSYNPSPEYEFMSAILSRIIKKKIKELEEKLK